MTPIHPYLNFDGQCEKAFRFYEKLFGGRIDSLTTHGETPTAEYVPFEWRDTVMHAYLNLGTFGLMGSDALPDRYIKPAGLYVSVQIENPDEAETIFAALADNGEIHMDLAETFWALRFGMLVDRFHIPWMINCPRPEYATPNV